MRFVYSMRLGRSEIPIPSQKSGSSNSSNSQKNSLPGSRSSSKTRKNSLVQCFSTGYESGSDIDSDEDAALQIIQKVRVHKGTSSLLSCISVKKKFQ